MSSVVGVTATYAARGPGNRDLFLHTKGVRVRLMYMTYFLCDGAGNCDSDFVHIERSQLVVTDGVAEALTHEGFNRGGGEATLTLTADEQNRAKRLANYLGATVDDLASEGLLLILQAHEPDLLINHATGEILGEFAFEECALDDFAD